MNTMDLYNRIWRNKETNCTECQFLVFKPDIHCYWEKAPHKCPKLQQNHGLNLEQIAVSAQDPGKMWPEPDAPSPAAPIPFN